MHAFTPTHNSRTLGCCTRSLLATTTKYPAQILWYAVASIGNYCTLHHSKRVQQYCTYCYVGNTNTRSVFTTGNTTANQNTNIPLFPTRRKTAERQIVSEYINISPQPVIFPSTDQGTLVMNAVPVVSHCRGELLNAHSQERKQQRTSHCVPESVFAPTDFNGG